jgi:hypothetical protein
MTQSSQKGADFVHLCEWLKAGAVAQCPNGECKFKKPLAAPVEVPA